MTFEAKYHVKCNMKFANSPATNYWDLTEVALPAGVEMAMLIFQSGICIQARTATTR
jgi:hypothetical protein